MLKHKHHKDNAVIPLTGTTITSEKSGSNKSPSSQTLKIFSKRLNSNKYLPLMQPQQC